jgi:hypothetical protein
MDGREGRPLVRLLIVVGSTRPVRVGDQVAALASLAGAAAEVGA